MTTEHTGFFGQGVWYGFHAGERLPQSGKFAYGGQVPQLVVCAVPIITLIGNGPRGCFVSKKLSGDSVFENV
jgi:hypothetical protein